MALGNSGFQNSFENHFYFSQIRNPLYIGLSSNVSGGPLKMGCHYRLQCHVKSLQETFQKAPLQSEKHAMECEVKSPNSKKGGGKKVFFFKNKSMSRKN